MARALAAGARGTAGPWPQCLPNGAAARARLRAFGVDLPGAARPTGRGSPPVIRADFRGSPHLAKAGPASRRQSRSRRAAAGA